MATMDESMRPGDTPHQGDAAPPPAQQERHGIALGMLAARRAIRGTIPADFIHDPSLEMLLSLYLALPDPVVSADLAQETTVSRVVAAHWIEALRAEGLLAVAGGQVALTDAGVGAMETMLAAVIASQRSLRGRNDH